MNLFKLSPDTLYNLTCDVIDTLEYMIPESSFLSNNEVYAQLKETLGYSLVHIRNVFDFSIGTTLAKYITRRKYTCLCNIYLCIFRLIHIIFGLSFPTPLSMLLFIPRLICIAPFTLSIIESPTLQINRPNLCLSIVFNCSKHTILSLSNIPLSKYTCVG